MCVRGRRRVVAGVVAVAGVLGVVPVLPAPTAVAATAAPVGADQLDDAVGDRHRLDRTERRLRTASDELARVQRAVDQVQREVAAAEQQMAVVSAQLIVVEDALADAQQDVRDAEERLVRARRRLSLADADLAVADARFRDARATLDDRAAMLWMRGPGAEIDLVLSGIGGARDLHDVAVIATTAHRHLDEGRRALHDATSRAAAVADIRADADAQRAAVTHATATAYGARAAADSLVLDQRALVEDAERLAGERRRSLAQVERDAAARAVLVERLTARVEQLRAAALEDWRRTVRLLPTDGPAPTWASRLPATGGPAAPAVAAAAAAAGVDERLLAALVWTESAFHPGAVSPAGAIGLTQLMPTTARELGVDPRDPVANLAGGARYLRTQLDRFARIDLALAAYNAGPQRVVAAGLEVPDILETQLYVVRVLERWQHLR